MDAKDKWTSDQQLDLLQNAAVDDLRQPESSNANKKKQLSKDNDLNETGLRRTLHGTIYQLKLLMLFLQTALNEKYEFKLYSEEKDAEKFDDIIFQYGKNKQYRFLQAKHKLNPECSKITVSELSSEKSHRQFSLQKYFVSFCRIEKNERFRGKVKDVIICTNTDFSDDIKNERLIKEEELDDILDIGGGKRYKLIFDKNKDIVEKLKDISDLNKLSKKLAKTFEGERLDLNDMLFKDYQIPLEKEIFDIKLIQKGTETEEHSTFRKIFIDDNNLSKEAKLLREAFEMEALKLNKNINCNEFWSTIDKKEFITSGKNVKQHAPKKEQFPNDFIRDDDIKRFFEKLVFAVKQPNEEKLNEIIEERIFNSLDDLKDDVNVEVIYDYFLKQMLDWLKSRESTALSNKDDFFKKGEEKVKEIRFRIPYLEYSSYIKSLDIKLNNKIKEFYNFLDSKNIFNLISSEKSIPLSQAKVYHIIPQSGWYLENLLNLKKFGNFKVRNLFENNRLIIVCRCESETKRNDIKILYNELVSYVTEQRSNKIILITQSDSILASYFKKGNLKDNFEQISDTTRIEDLDQDYLLETLSNKTIIFQDQKKKLSQLINIESEELINNRFTVENMHKLERIFNSDTLNELLLDTNIKVGNKLPDFRDSNSPYYDPCYIDIPRTFSYQVIERNSLKECIKERKEDLFTFSFTSEDYMLKDILDFGEKNKIKDFKSKASNNSDNKFFEGRFFMLDKENPEKDFNKLFNNSNGRTVHWLKYIGNHNFMVEYSDNLSNLRRFIKMMDIGKEIKSSLVVIIFGAAGVGKSTVLTKYFQELNPLSWLIRIDLKDHQEYIKNANFNNLEGIVDFFCQSDLVILETALAQKLLKYYLKYYPHQIILLLDGFDEIKNDNQEKIMQLLKFFKNTKRKVWLTARLNEQYKIENALKTVAFSYFLNSFDEKEQENFLNQYWIKKLKVKESEQEEKDNIAKFTTELLHHFYNLGLMKENDGFIGIVLQARMVAEIIYPKPKFNSSEIGINNISDLYEKFTELQYERYFTQKLNVNIKLLGKGLQITLINSYTKAHGYLALNALFSENQSCKKLLKNRKYEKFSQDELSGVGFIKKFRDSYIADFIHHTYAEYFVAKLYADILGKETDNPKYDLIREVLLRTIFLDRNSLIRIFLEQEIQKKPSNDNVKIKWKEIQECDLLGEMETNNILSCFNSTFVRGSNATREIQHDTNETLSELKKCLASSVQRLTHDLYFDLYPSEYHLNHDVIIIKNFFLQFLKVTDIQELDSSLFCLTKVNDILKFRLGSHAWHAFIDENLDNAIKHYLTQVKMQNVSNIEVNKITFEFDNMQDIQNFADMLNELKEAKNSANKIEKKKHLEQLLYLLIPKCKYSIHDLGRLNNSVYFLFYTYEQSAIKDINSFRSIQRRYKEKILNFLVNMFDAGKIIFDIGNNIASMLENVGVKYLQSFFIDITHHSAIIADTTLSINKIFQCRKNNFNWMITEGILIFRLLKILTPEMSKMFNSVSDNFFSLNSDYIEDYIVCVLDNIMYIIDTLKTDKFPQIDKLALFKMITYFVTFFMVFRGNRSLPFTLNQFETILELLENILNEQQKPVLELRESVEFLFVLRKAGLKLINTADQKILILDPISEFQFELSSGYKDQIIELIEEEWKMRK